MYYFFYSWFIRYRIIIQTSDLLSLWQLKVLSTWKEPLKVFSTIQLILLSGISNNNLCSLHSILLRDGLISYCLLSIKGGFINRHTISYVLRCACLLIPYFYELILLCKNLCSIWMISWCVKCLRWLFNLIKIGIDSKA